MKLVVNKSRLSGPVEIPGSKSHTIRAVALASLAEGRSVIRRPLVAADTLAAVNAYRLFGADISVSDEWSVSGAAGRPRVPENVIDVGNSGTTLYVTLGTAALVEGSSVLTGDDQIRRRPCGPLIRALSEVGATVESTRQNDAAPLIVRGPMRGGSVKLDGSKTSQYLTSLLINCPLASGDTDITVRNLIERPYIEMTLAWVREQGIKVENEGFERFALPGGQRYSAFDRAIPGDFSSATFFLCAAAITGSEIILTGLDPNDTQGDKVVVDMLAEMGAKVEWRPEGLRVAGGKLKGAEFDLGDTPDALPALAVTACFAEGITRLVGVGQARLKETDRITVMREELTKMGGRVEELPDGLVVQGSRMRPAPVHGRFDHRVIMAFAIAGLCLDGETVVESAEALGVTFPTFVELMQAAGAQMRTAQ